MWISCYTIRAVSELLAGFKEVLILMPSYWELQAQLDKLQPVRREALANRAMIVEEQAKLATDLMVADSRLAQVVADIAVLEVQLGEVQKRTDKVLGKVIRDEYPTVLDIKGA